MNHKQILDKLTAKHAIKSIEEDLSMLIYKAMCFEKDHDTQLNFFIPKFFLRWDCILQNNASEFRTLKYQIWLIIATILHKNGFKVDYITKNALDALDYLNKEVVLNDDFYRKSEQIKMFIQSKPIPLKRKPKYIEPQTFLRPKDLIVLELKNSFYGAYVHEIYGTNQNPIIEFYDLKFSRLPKMDNFINQSAYGELFDDGIRRISKYSIRGMRFIPDIANQYQIIASNFNYAPNNSKLKKAIGNFTVSDIYEIQDIVLMIE